MPFVTRNFWTVVNCGFVCVCMVVDCVMLPVLAWWLIVMLPVLAVIGMAAGRVEIVLTMVGVVAS